MGAELVLLLLALACVRATLPVNWDSQLAAATQVCHIEMKLRDGYGDGWNGNRIQMKAGPSTAVYAVPLTPNTELCGTSNDTFGAPTYGTLLDSDYCSFSADIPAGWNVEFDFLWEWANWPDENFITVQLSYVQSYFGPVVLSTSQFHEQVVDPTHKCNVPYLNPVFTLSCGPLPSAVSAVTATPNTVGTGSALAQTVIAWTPVIAAGIPLAFAVTVQDLSGTEKRPLGVYTSSSVQALLLGNTNYLITVKPLNKFGEGPETSVTVRTHPHETAMLDAIMFASRPHAWYPDGRLVVLVDNAIVGIGTVEGDVVQNTMSFPIPADGGSHTVAVHFVSPTGGSAGECSYRIAKDGVDLFVSANTAQGPTYFDGYFQVTAPPPPKVCGVCCLGAGKCPADPDGYCCDEGDICCKTGTTDVKPYSCCKGAQKCLTNYTGSTPSRKTCAVPVSTCPDAEPTEGTGCYGSLNCNYRSDCCCPGDTDQVCGPTVKYSCTGESGASWTRTNLSLPCTSDPSFSCPDSCPTQEPVSTQQCLGSRTCLYGKSCCCPNEDTAEKQGCTYQRQWKCTGVTGGNWALTNIVPQACPALCFSQSKTGECPVLGAGTCTGVSSDLCAVDSQCNGTSKCCPGTCGKSCIQPCDCSVTPTCQCWETVIFTAGPGCCGGTKSCATDPTSTQCPTAVPDWDSLQCVVNSGTCGDGVKTRTKNIRDPVLGCRAVTETSPCNVPCPVNCVGAFGPCGTCSSNCRGGTCKRTYAISVQPNYGGQPCPFSAGALSDPEPCPNLPPCPMYCPIRIVAKDTYGDGWTYGTPKGYVNVYDNSTQQLYMSQWISGVKMNSSALLIPSGTTLKLVYTKDKYAWEAMIQLTTNENNVQGQALYQDPADVGIWGNKAANPNGPVPVAYYTVRCNDCSQVNAQYCATQEHRAACTLFSTASASGCGPCLPGYWQPTSNGPCVDVNECQQQYNPCAMAGANCTNTQGGYTCTCPPGTNFLYGYCETPGVCPQQRFRMEWFDMTPRQRHLYRQAYVCLYNAGMYPALYQLHSAGPTGTGYPSPFHYGHDQGSGFWYWHRTFSLRFEDMVRSCSYIMNMPELRCFVGAYWDSPSMILAADTPNDRYLRVKNNFFTSAKTVEGYYTGIGTRQSTCDPNHPYNFLSPTDCWRRGADTANPPNWDGSDIQWAVVATANDLQTLSQLQSKHFAMHPYVGGDFGGVESSRDPLFFLHHNYYDMIWEVWKACKSKPAWPLAAYQDRWFAYVASQDYNPDLPMLGFSAYPQDVWDNQNLIVRLATTPPSTTSTSVVYSSSSLTRAQSAGVYNCPVVISRYVQASLPVGSAPAALEMRSTLTSLLQRKSKGPKERARTTFPDVPLHLWATNNKQLHPESHSEWRENLRRFTGASHTPYERHVNVLAHNWRAPRSAFGRAAWLEAVHRDEPASTQDIGQQCRELTKTLVGQGVATNQAYLAGLDCECEKTGGSLLEPLSSEFIRSMRIPDVCLIDGCQNTCEIIEGLMHGKPEPDEDENENDNATIATVDTTPHLLTRLTERVLGSN